MGYVLSEKFKKCYLGQAWEMPGFLGGVCGLIGLASDQNGRAPVKWEKAPAKFGNPPVNYCEKN
jgi:hypothetical protein